MFIATSISSLNNAGSGTQLYSPDRSRMSIYFKDGQRTDNSFISTETGVTSANGLFRVSTQGVDTNSLSDDPSAFLKAKDFQLQDKFGNTQKMRVQTSNSGSSNYKAKSIQFDRADYGALVNLANKARKVKSYEYFVFPNVNTASTTGLTRFTKASGVADPVKLTDVQRAYVGVLNDGSWLYIITEDEIRVSVIIKVS